MRIEVVKAINSNLEKMILLIEEMPKSIYDNDSVPPFHSSIGSHIRHILDFYSCILDGVHNNVIDLTARKRDQSIAKNYGKAIAKIKEIQNEILSLQKANTNYIIKVIDDLGVGKVDVDYTLESVFAQANSHAIHHFAIISQVLFQLGVNCTIEGFGYNPTTPVVKKKVNQKDF